MRQPREACPEARGGWSSTDHSPSGRGSIVGLLCCDGFPPEEVSLSSTGTHVYGGGEANVNCRMND